MPNIHSSIPAALPSERVETLLETAILRIERIVSHGHASPQGFWYDQGQREWVLLIQGAARLRFDDDVVELQPGDFISIQAHQRHRVDWTTPDEQTIWLAVHYGDQR